MKTMTSRCLILLASALLLVGAAASAGAATSSALGNDGELYRVVAGPYGELFPEGTTGSGTEPALALEVLYSDRVVRLPVPGTVGPEREHSAALVFEPGSRTTFIVWGSDYKLINSSVSLVGFRWQDGPSWTETVDISGDPFSLKGPPTLAITRDSLPGADGTDSTRTVLHTVWWEETGVRAQITYAPVVLLDGEFVHHDRTWILNDLQASGASTRLSGYEALAQHPVLRTTDDGRSLMVGFVDGEQGTLVTAEIRVVAGELAALAQVVHDYVADTAPSACADPDWAASIQATALEHASERLGEGVARHLALSVGSWAASQDLCTEVPSAEDVLSVAEKARSHIILVGLRTTGRDAFDRVAKARSHIILVGLRRSPERGVRELELGYRSIARANLPETNGSVEALFLGTHGERIVMAWESSEDPSVLVYREHQDDTWSETRTLVLGPDFSRNEADRVLQQLADSH